MPAGMVTDAGTWILLGSLETRDTTSSKGSGAESCKLPALVRIPGLSIVVVGRVTVIETGGRMLAVRGICSEGLFGSSEVKMITF